MVRKEYDPTIDDAYIVERFNRVMNCFQSPTYGLKRKKIINILNKIYEDGFEDGCNETEQEQR